MATGGSEEIKVVGVVEDPKEDHTLCHKNPGHARFIPVFGLEIKDLPPSCQDSELLLLVRAKADITVLVTCKYESESRPVPFQFNRGRDHLPRCGTGFIYEVKIFQNTNSEVCSNSKNETCYCKDCHNSSKQYSDYAEIKIVTMDHVIYDKLEAAQTTCHLFFDGGNSPSSCDGVVTFEGMSGLERDVHTSNVLMTFVTHDLGLAETLFRKRNLCKRLFERVSIKYLTPACKSLKSPRPPGCERDIWHALTVLVAHPHGWKQHVSFGHCAEIDMKNTGHTKHSYTAATCPGSSGALVFIMGKYSWTNWKQMNVHVGIEYMERKRKHFNYCECTFSDEIVPKRGVKDQEENTQKAMEEEQARSKEEEKVQGKEENKAQGKEDEKAQYKEEEKAQSTEEEKAQCKEERQMQCTEEEKAQRKE